MKQLVSIIVAVSIIFIASCSRSTQANNEKIQGAWDLTHEGVNLSKDESQIKLITRNHFVWVTYDTKTKKARIMGGGTYTLTGDDYVEHVDFLGPVPPEADQAFSNLIGKEQRLKVHVNGTRLELSGGLTDGEKIQEVWTRLESQ